MDINNLMEQMPQNETLAKAWFPKPTDESLESKVADREDWSEIKAIVDKLCNQSEEQK